MTEDDDIKQLRADNRLLALVLRGQTPDLNTQSPSEAKITESMIEAAIVRALLPKEHVLKTRADFWAALENGTKNFEVRRNDRGFQVGDLLVLVCPEKGAGYEIRKRVRYILEGSHSYGLDPDYVVLGLGDCEH